MKQATVTKTLIVVGLVLLGTFAAGFTIGARTAIVDNMGEAYTRGYENAIEEISGGMK